MKAEEGIINLERTQVLYNLHSLPETLVKIYDISSKDKSKLPRNNGILWLTARTETN